MGLLHRAGVPARAGPDGDFARAGVRPLETDELDVVRIDGVPRRGADQLEAVTSND